MSKRSILQASAGCQYKELIQEKDHLRRRLDNYLRKKDPTMICVIALILLCSTTLACSIDEIRLHGHRMLKVTTHNIPDNKASLIRKFSLEPKAKKKLMPDQKLQKLPDQIDHHLATIVQAMHILQ